ncbi:ABC transporter ATP-binding protein [Amycolatopsis pigmentata]|uniref:ABC transporter ATP-binding protein n=1 Tax=Amycolatopsis pigmentata TaxID=450801 RepID=A0ABW5FS02_9PSEU
MRLDITGLRSGYGAGTVVNGVDLTVADQEVVAVVGRNGMGKSSLVKTILGYLPDVQGSVELDGAQQCGLRTHTITRRGVAYAPQEAAVFAGLTVRDNLYGGLRRHKPDARTTERLFDAFPVLAARLDQKAGTLSGGEQKVLLLTRCLLRDPRLLVLDEISAGLQPSMVNAVTDVLLAIRAERRLTVLMVEQNIDLCLSLARRIVVMKAGRFIAEAFRDTPDVRTTLLGHLAP